MSEDGPDDVSIDFDSDLPPRIPPGNYTLAFIHAHKRWLWGRRLKLFMTFEIVYPIEYAGVRLFMCCNVPEKKKWTVGFKFFRCWTLATGKRPDRRDRLSTSVFRGKYFLGRVRTVERSAKDTKRAAAAQYSIVDELLSIEAGG
ncbi:MAG: hypothetical protein ABIU05_19745 [Nitrospirales bacterium]